MKRKSNIFQTRTLLNLTKDGRSRSFSKSSTLTDSISKITLGLAVLLGSVSHASATDLYWISGGTGFDWTTAGGGGNWAYYDDANAGFFYSSAAPTASDSTIFGWLEAPTTVDITPGATTAGVRVLAGTADFNLQGNTLTSTGQLTVGDGASGTLNADGGTVNAAYLIIGAGAGNSGILNLTNTTLNTGPSYSEVGFNASSASGIVNLGTGGVWNSGGAIYVGDAGATGAVNLTSASSRLNGSLISFGFDGGNGSLSLSSGSVVTAQKLREDLGSGTITIDNGTLVATGNESDFISGFEAGDVVINAGGLTINTQAFAVGIGSTLQGTGGVTKTGNGALTLSGTHNYSGGTSVLAGSLVASGDSSLSAASAVTLATGTTLDASATGSQMVAGLSGSGNLILGSGEFNITSNTDASFTGVISGAGSLLKAGSGKLTLSGANTYAGDTFVTGGGISANSNGSFGHDAGSVHLADGTTLFTTATFSSTRPLFVDGNAVNLNIKTATSLTTSGPITGTAGIEKTGDGTLMLVGGAGQNTYLGDTTISAGSLKAGSEGIFNATSNVVLAVNSANIDLNGHNQRIGALSGVGSVLLGSGTLTTETSLNTTFEGAISGSGGIVKSGAGTLMLAGAAGQNTYLGDTRITAGSLKAGSAGIFNATSNLILAGNFANIDLNGHNQGIGALSGVGSVLLGSGTLTTETHLNTTFEGAISGSGGIVKSGVGILTLLNTTSSYSGGTTVNGGGALIVADNSNLGAASGSLTLDDGTLKLRASPPIGTILARNITLGTGGGTFDTTGRSITLSNAITGNGTLTKDGSGTLVLGNSANTYSGGTVIKAGAIQISSNSALGNTSGAVTLEGGSLIVSGSVSTNRSFLGNGPLIKEGTGLLILSGTGSSYLGGTFVNQGKLRFTNDSNLGLMSNVTLNGGSLSASGSMSSSRDLNLMLDSQFEVIAGAATWNGSIHGDKTLTKTGNGVLVANGFNMHKGFIVQQGVLQIADDINIGNPDSSVVLNGGTLRIASSTTITRDIRIGTGTLDTGSNHVNLSILALPDYSYGTVTKTGTGSLTVNASDKLGTFNVTNGSLKPASSNSLASHQQINLQTNGSLDISGSSANIRSLGGVAGADVILGSNTLTIGASADQSGNFAGDISGTGSVVKTGGYTQTLSGTNSYSGGTTVTGGSMIFGSASAVPGSGLILNQAYTGAGYAMDQAFLDSFDKPSSNGVIGIQVATSNPLSLVGFSSSASLGTDVSSGVAVSSTITPQGSTYRLAGGYGRINLSSDLSGSRNLQVDSLQLYLSGNNTLTNGITAGSGGVVVFENSTAIPVSGNLVASSNGYVGTMQPLDQAFLNRFDKSATSGVIGMNTDTSNPLDLTGFAAGASLGTVVGGSGITLSGLITPQGANYRFGGVSSAPTGTLTVASALTGSRGLDVSQINLSLTGANSYSGPTTVSSGTIRVADNSRLGTGKLVLNYGTYQPTASFASSREIEIIGYGDISTDSGTLLPHKSSTPKDS